MKLYMGIVIASACLVATIAGEGFIGGRFLDPPVPSKCPNSKFFLYDFETAETSVEEILQP